MCTHPQTSCPSFPLYLLQLQTLCLCLLWLWPQPIQLSHNHTTFITTYPNVVEGTCPFSRWFTQLYHQRQFLIHISQTYDSKCPPDHICISLLYMVGHSSIQVAGWWPWRILHIWSLRTVRLSSQEPLDVGAARYIARLTCNSLPSATWRYIYAIEMQSYPMEDMLVQWSCLLRTSLLSISRQNCTLNLHIWF